MWPFTAAIDNTYFGDLGPKNTNSLIFGHIWLLQLRSISVKHGIIPIVMRQRYHSMASKPKQYRQFLWSNLYKELWSNQIHSNWLLSRTSGCSTNHSPIIFVEPASWWSWWLFKCFSNPQTDLCGIIPKYGIPWSHHRAASKVKMEKVPPGRVDWDEQNSKGNPEKWE